MQYVLLIYQGATPRAETLSEEEYQAIAAEYGTINRTPGVTPGLPLGLPENATTVRVQDGKTLTTDAPSGSSRRRSADTTSWRPTTSMRRSSWPRGSRRPVLGAQSRCARPNGIGNDPRAGLPRALGPGARCVDRLPRRLRPRGGSRSVRRSGRPSRGGSEQGMDAETTLLVYGAWSADALGGRRRDVGEACSAQVTAKRSG